MNEQNSSSKRSLWLAAFVGGSLSSLLIFSLLAFSGIGFQGLTGPGPQAKPVPQVTQVSSTISAAKTVSPAVVGIANLAPVENEFAGTKVVERGSGSGVIFDSSGLIVTNNHVVAGARELVVSLADGRQTRAILLGRDPATDLAVLKVRTPGLVAAKFGDSDKLQVGETVIAIGNPLGKEFARSVTVGVVSAVNRPLNVGERLFKLIQTDAAINPGNSGGALVNPQGQVVGINSAKLAAPGIEGMGFAIPINDARPIINELINRGRVQRSWMGVKAATIDGVINQKFGLPTGVLINKVAVNSPAHQAGLRRGDVITAVEGHRINEMEDLSTILKDCCAGDLVKVRVYRNRHQMELKVNLGEENLIKEE